MDFGLAKAASDVSQMSITQSGIIMGTPNYISPEQGRGDPTDTRSDLYSLGIVMYEMVAGKPPFAGDNPVSIAYKQVHDQPTPLNRLVDGVPRPFEAIVAKLLAKDPKLRYPSAHALRDDLRRFRNGEQVQALVAAAARPTPPLATPPRPVGTTQPVGTTPTIVQPSPTSGTTAHPPIAGAPTAAMPRQPGPDLTGYPPGASSEARYYQDSSSRTGWYALAAFVALVALVAGGVLLYQGLTKEADTTTTAITLDDYTNQPLQSVTGALTALKLPYEVFPEENPQVPEDFVHRTVPAAGTVVAEGTVIELYYNPTRALVTVPNVEGRSLVDAVAILGNSGFRIEEVTELSAVAEGLVIRTEPAAESQVPQEQVITVVVSGGPDQVSIPATVINDPVDVARELLESEQYGFVVTILEQVDETIPAGVVISTDPAPNMLVARGSTVQLIVSSGPGQVRVPPLVGLTEGQARNSLDEVGLGIEVTYRELEPGSPADGTVLEQSVRSGEEVDLAMVISVVVGQAQVAPTTTTTTTTVPTTVVPDTTVPPTTAAVTTTTP